jgi:hypothetical protein
MMNAREHKTGNTPGHKMDFSFLRNVAVAFGVIVIAAAYPLVRYSTHEILVGCLGGAAISYANVIAGFVAIEYSFDKSFTTFMKAVLGGMGIRMLVSAAVLVAMISLLHMHVAALISSLMFFYIVNLTLEIFFLQKKMELRTQPVR